MARHAARLVLLAAAARGAVIINEIADRGGGGACSASDWIELYNNGGSSVSLTGYVLHDSKGAGADDAYTFGSGASIGAGAYLVVCASGTADGGAVFGINPFDSVTLLDNSGAEVGATGAMTGDGGSPGVSYAWNGGAYAYTSTATPGSANAFTAVVPRKTRLAEQEAKGAWFFGVESAGQQISGADAIVDFKVYMDTADYEFFSTKAYEETFKDFTRIEVTTSQGTEVLASPGLIRPRGQSTLAIPFCLGLSAIPFGIDFAAYNQSQTLFGMERLYLRQHMGDASFMREWYVHRALARFQLPYLRTRHVHLCGFRRRLRRRLPPGPRPRWGGDLRERVPHAGTSTTSGSASTRSWSR